MIGSGWGNVMQFTSVLSAGFLVLSTASAGHATTTEIFDSTHETFTLSTTVTSEFNVPCCEESASFNGSFTISSLDSMGSMTRRSIRCS